MNAMYNPPHPGGLLKTFILPELGLNLSEAARILGVSRDTLAAVANGRRAVSPKLALKLAKAFGGSAEHWLRMQACYDLWQVAQHYQPDDVPALHSSLLS